MTDKKFQSMLVDWLRAKLAADGLSTAVLRIQNYLAGRGGAPDTHSIRLWADRLTDYLDAAVTMRLHRIELLKDHELVKKTTKKGKK